MTESHILGWPGAPPCDPLLERFLAADDIDAPFE